MRPVAGLPLIHVEKPSYHGAKRSGKRFFDLAFSLTALTMLVLAFAVVALLIKLDGEFPQFINVLRGEMSVVGPRPPLRCEVENYDGRVKRRLLVRPGVTGLWQV